MIATSSSKQSSGAVQALDITLIVISNINVVLHTLGLYLLFCLPTKKVQQWLLISLSVSELLKNILIQVIILPHILNVATETWETQVYVYLTFFYDYGVTGLYYLTMYFITFDRLLKIHLSNSYSSYCNVQRVKYLLLAIGCFCFFVSVVLSVAYFVSGGGEGTTMQYFVFTRYTEAEFVVYAHPCLDILFLLLATVTYYKIFKTYMRSQRRVSRQSLATKKKAQSMCKKMAQSTFSVPILLILSFIFFAVVPDLISSYYEISKQDVPYSVEMVCYLMFLLSDLCDVGIYIFMQRPVRSLLLKKLGFYSTTPRFDTENHPNSMYLRRQSSVNGRKFWVHLT